MVLPVHGFRLAPGTSFNMVLGVAPEDPGRATSRGMLVYYHYSAGSYVAKNYFATVIAVTLASDALVPRLAFRFAPLTSSATPRLKPLDHWTAFPKSPP